MANLFRLLQFVELTHAFQEIKRHVYVRGKEARENDVEHSYQLAMAAWFLVDTSSLNLNKDLIIKYALVHDLVEVYAGDTYFYDHVNNDNELRKKKEREQEAAERLKNEFPEFGELHTLIGQYEAKTDDESRFVYALDKVLPVLNIYLDDGRTWHTDNVTLEMLIDGKTDKVAVSEEVKPYFDDLVAVLKKDEARLFPQKGSGDDT